jgi:SAM-dependent methyltransferase
MAGSAATHGEMLTQEAAHGWIERWDAQQQVYMPDREDRFTALIDALEAATGRPDPLVLDLGCGPGSLAIRLLRRLPRARVVAIDADPLTLALGRAAWAGEPGLTFTDADLRVPGWSSGLGLEREPDAAISTTALHWLTETALNAVYAEVAGLLRPGGVVLNGDHMLEDDAAPRLIALGRALIERADRRRRERPDGAGAAAETWDAWWQAAATDPDLAALNDVRLERRVESEHHGSPAARLSVQVRALQAAGFAEVGTLWQLGDNRLLCAIMPGGEVAG